MDCFFAAVEMRDNPELRTIALAVGGSKDRRGVISTCNYLARKYGIHSAMPTAHALKLCPNLTVVPGDMEKYKRVSVDIQAIFARYTNKVEPLSLDEAYLDVSDCSLFRGSATMIAQDIRQVIKSELGLTASAGVAPVKFIAKIASDINKPDGLFVITPAEIDAFVKTLPLEKIPGVGKVTLAKLHQMGLYHGVDVQQYDRNTLLKKWGKLGYSLWNRCHGIDERKVETNCIRKSVSVELTLAEDIQTYDQCLLVMRSLYGEMERRLKRICPDMDIARQGVKLKFSDFQQTTVEHRQGQYEQAYFPVLLKEALTRQQGRAVRLIGLNVGLKTQEASEFSQLSFEW